MTSTRFPGLDSLRFLAALFVVIGHIPMTQAAVGLPSPTWSAAFFRGAHAVCFFFTLSGFLITYLLLEERRRTSTVDVWRFYVRRMYRIWPLYFAVVALGLAFYKGLLPWLGIGHSAPYRVSTAVLLYVFFLPNLMNSLCPVGGILNPLWSIGVEEQFYLAWAPLVRRVRDRLPALCWTIAALSLTVFVLSRADLFGVGRAKHFLGQLKFHFMAVGALWAFAAHRHRARLLALPVFSSRLLQLVLFALLIEHYLAGRLAGGEVAAELLQLALYGWLIVNVAVNLRNVIRIANAAFEYLGKISYGIYMLHMPAVYATAALFLRSNWWHGHQSAYLFVYYVLALGITVALAAISYHYFELPFLRMKDRVSPIPGASPGGARPLPVASVDASP